MATSKVLRSMIPVLLFANTALAATDIEFVVDVSGSMRQKLGAETQMESARKALLKSLDEIPKGQMVAVRVYGHRVEQSNKQESCKDTELLIPFHDVDKQLVMSKLAELTPRGYTPIAYSLMETRNDLYDVGIAREAERVIILLTDGEETCDGDPIAVLDQLKKEGFKLTVFTVGFNVNDVARKQLQDIAAFTGGKYFDAKDAGQLNKALQEAAQQSVLISKPASKSYGNSIRGGDSYEEAVPLEIGKEYKLDHHQEKLKHDYFYVDIDKAAELDVTINTTDIGISGVKDGTPREIPHPYGGIEIHGQQRNRLKHEDIVGDQFKTKQLSFRPSESGRYYILVGTDYGDIHKDYFTFKLELESQGDLNTEKDAGESFEAALPIEPKRYDKSYIGDGDKVDVFAFPVKAGETYFAGIVPATKNESYFQLRVLDEFRQAVFSESGRAGEGVRTKNVQIADEGNYYLEVTYYGNDTVPYALLLKKVEKLEGGGPATGEGVPQ